MGRGVTLYFLKSQTTPDADIYVYAFILSTRIPSSRLSFPQLWFDEALQYTDGTVQLADTGHFVQLDFAHADATTNPFSPHPVVQTPVIWNESWAGEREGVEENGFLRRELWKQ